MNKNMLCSRCHKNPAVFFISKIDGDKTTNEGLCIKCAMELNIGPVKQIMDQMGISEDEMNDVAEQMNQMMENPDGIEGFQPGGASPIYIFPVCQINCAPDALILSKPSITQLLMVRAPKLPPTIRIVFLDGSSPKERIASSRLM